MSSSTSLSCTYVLYSLKYPQTTKIKPKTSPLPNWLYQEVNFSFDFGVKRGFAAAR